jgi:hypothetical protein
VKKPEPYAWETAWANSAPVGTKRMLCEVDDVAKPIPKGQTALLIEIDSVGNVWDVRPYTVFGKQLNANMPLSEIIK